MIYKVLSPFNTATQRFRVGASVSEADDLSPHTIASLLEQKRIGTEGGKTPVYRPKDETT